MIKYFTGREYNKLHLGRKFAFQLFVTVLLCKLYKRAKKLNSKTNIYKKLCRQVVTVDGYKSLFNTMFN